jgi:hypothetical protein
MLIEKFEVEEGFLDGLVIHFDEGLNVLVGPRGTGKTSIIELIRFCLDVSAFTEETARLARQHALDVLGSGRVTLTVSFGGLKYSISRAAGEREPRLSAPARILPTTILSQKEIEKVGLDPGGILRLIDEFNPPSLIVSREETRCLEQIRATTTESKRIADEVADLEDTLTESRSLLEALAEARIQESNFQESLAGFTAERNELEKLSGQLALLVRQGTTVEEALRRMQQWNDRFRSSPMGLQEIPAWPKEAGPQDLLKGVREWLPETMRLLKSQIDLLQAHVGSVKLLDEGIRQAQATLGDQSRQLRRTLDVAAKGAGEATARVARLREDVVRRESLSTRLMELRSTHQNLQIQRGKHLDELDSIRETKFLARRDTCEALNSLLSPRIDLRVVRYGIQADYAARLSSVLRGTRLHYNQLAPVLAAALTPRELVEAAESGDAHTVANIAGIDVERVDKIFDAIRENGGGEILASELEDLIELRLLDGAEYKLSKNLSTGQRCTAVLPLLLEQRGRVLIIDQPEDHLDNGFIAETVVRSITTRPTEDQLIVASHNANIPVLGEARKVVVLESDGTRARLASEDSLDSPSSVEAITRIMEGGKEAFARRGRFYRDHETKSS